MEHLSEQALKRGKTVAMTTTTKIYARQPYLLFDEVFRARGQGSSVRIGRAVEGEKLTGIGLDDVTVLGEKYDLIIVEADGAKGKPLKYPAPYEPMIPPSSEIVFVISGLDSLFKKVNQAVFRWELLTRATDIGGETVITPDVFVRFFSQDILLKHVGRKKCIVLLNKYDAVREKDAVVMVAKALLKVPCEAKVIVGSVRFRSFYEVQEILPPIGSPGLPTGP